MIFWAIVFSSIRVNQKKSVHLIFFFQLNISFWLFFSSENLHSEFSRFCEIKAKPCCVYLKFWTLSATDQIDSCSTIEVENKKEKHKRELGRRKVFATNRVLWFCANEKNNCAIKIDDFNLDRTWKIVQVRLFLFHFFSQPDFPIGNERKKRIFDWSEFRSSRTTPHRIVYYFVFFFSSECYVHNFYDMFHFCSQNTRTEWYWCRVWYCDRYKS